MAILCATDNLGCQMIIPVQPTAGRSPTRCRVPRGRLDRPSFIARAPPPAPTHEYKERETVTRPKKITYGHLVSLGSRLTDRDRQIAVDCYDHHVLTTRQLLRLHFDGLRCTTARLNILYQLRVLDRFRPSMPMGEGTAPYHWVLDEAGAHIVAAREEIERRSLRWRHSDAIRVAYSGKLRHHIEINEFFSLLSAEAEAKDGRLAEWYGERTTHRLFDGMTPDGWGVLTLPHRPPVHLLLELDRATEPTKRLRQKAVWNGTRWTAS